MTDTAQDLTLEALVFANENNEQPITTSKIIAVYFGKRHSDVLRDIRELLTQVDGDFAKRNFALVIETMTYTNKDGEQVTKQTDRASHYTITKDGFMLLCMGYTGKKAMKIKLAYIEAFNKMHQALIDRQCNLQAEYSRAWLDYEIATMKASEAGRALNYLGKQVKPQCKERVDYLHTKIQPELPFEAVLV